VHGKRPRIVRDNGSQFVAKEWREIMRHFEVEEIPIRARDLLAEWVTYYNEERLHSALEYLRPVDYYLGNPQALLAERKRKLREAAVRRKEVNSGKKETKLENGAEAIEEVRT
jgi:hypothetical protein